MTTTKQERRRQVAQMCANFALEGLQPDATDRALQAAYICGQITLADMLAYANSYAASVA